MPSCVNPEVHRLSHRARHAANLCFDFKLCLQSGGVFLRGQKILLDADLIARYGVDTRRLNAQVHWNMERFPRISVEVNDDEFANLKSHFGTSTWGGRCKRPLRIETAI
jgi:hypothetical protein